MTQIHPDQNLFFNPRGNRLAALNESSGDYEHAVGCHHRVGHGERGNRGALLSPDDQLTGNQPECCLPHHSDL